MSFCTQAAVEVNTARAVSASSNGRAKLAPSPPKAKGKSSRSSAFETATINAPPAMFTILYWPARIAAVEATTSDMPINQSSGSGRYKAASVSWLKP
jgi:hypothetical protein